MKLGLIIIDTNQKNLDQTLSLAKRTKVTLEIVGSYVGIPTDVNLMRFMRPMIFLLPFESHKSFEIQFPLIKREEIILFGNSQDCKIEAFRLGVFDFLLRPINKDLFEKIMLKFQKNFPKKFTPQNHDATIIDLRNKLDSLLYKTKTVSFTTKEGIEFIALSDISRCELDTGRSFLIIHSTYQKKEVLHSKEELQKKLTPHGFILVGTDLIINRINVSKLQKSLLVMTNGDKIQIEGVFLQELKKSLRNLE